MEAEVQSTQGKWMILYLFVPVFDLLNAAYIILWLTCTCLVHALSLGRLSISPHSYAPFFFKPCLTLASNPI